MSETPQKRTPNSRSAETVRDPGPRSAPAFLWLRRADQWLLGGLLCVCTVLLGLHWLRLNGWGPANEPVTVLTAEGYLFTLDVNHATWVEWAQLDGIGETLARRIVQDRIDRGPFASIEEVTRVKGIGSKTMDRIRPHLRQRDVFTAESGSTTKPPAWGADVRLD